MKKSVHTNVQFVKKTFSQKGSLNHHITTVHEGKQPHKCPIGKEKFAIKSNLNIHIAFSKDNVYSISLFYILNFSVNML